MQGNTQPKNTDLSMGTVSAITPMGDSKGMENTLAKRMYMSMGHISFKPRALAYHITLWPSAIQKVFYKVCLDYIAYMNHKLFNDGIRDIEEHEIAISCARIQETMDRYPYG